MDHTYTIKKITEILEKMKTIEPLPPIGSPAYHADVAGWMARREQIAKCEQSVEILALLTVPLEIHVLVTQMRAQRQALFPVIVFQDEETPNA